MSTLENLKKSAKRWLSALRARDADARARLKRAYPNAPSDPALRDVQHALAREHGRESWGDLRRALHDAVQNAMATPDVDQYERLAKDFLAAYHTGDSPAMHRLQERLHRPITWEALRAEVDRRLEQLPEGERPHGGLTLAHVRHFVARTAGFENWAVFLDALRVDDRYQTQGTRVAVTIPPQARSGPSNMLQPVELRLTLPMQLHDGQYLDDHRSVADASRHPCR